MSQKMLKNKRIGHLNKFLAKKRYEIIRENYNFAIKQ